MNGTQVQGELARAVLELARRALTWDAATLANGAWAWGDYAGVRMALLGTTQDLDDLAADVLAERIAAGQPPSTAQQLLARHREAFRDLQALLLDQAEETLRQSPAQEEWSVLETLQHIYGAERGFFASILAGLEAQARGEAPGPLDRASAERLTAEAGERPAGEDPAGVWVAYERLHFLIGERLAGLNDEQLAALSPFWEPVQPAVRFRMGRFTAHLREHTVQVENTLHAVVGPPGEARLLVRQLLAALARVEATCVGLETPPEPVSRWAETIAQRIRGVEEALRGAQQMILAIRSGDDETVRRLLDANPQLVHAGDENGMPGLTVALYHHQLDIARLLRAAGAWATVYEAAALGELETVQGWVGRNPSLATAFARDGFTALQLACYYGHPEVAAYLLEQGADVHAVSRNDMGLQAIHAAVAGRNPDCVRMLIEAGADVNATQASGHTPMQAALKNQDEAIVALLRAAGAD